jgi:predicted nucleotidyltransferase
MLTLPKNNTALILDLFFRNPDKEYYLREIGRQLNKEPGYFQHTVKGLLKEGILSERREANLRYLKLNKNHPLYDELKKIISKTLGIEAQLKELAGQLGGVEYAFIFGSIAKNKEYALSDIDLLLVGKVDQDDLIGKINKLEEDLKREINYHIYDKKEVIRKLADKNEFLERIFHEPKIILKGNPDELTKSN